MPTIITHLQRQSCVLTPILKNSNFFRQLSHRIGILGLRFETTAQVSHSRSQYFFTLYKVSQTSEGHHINSFTRARATCWRIIAASIRSIRISADFFEQSVRITDDTGLSNRWNKHNNACPELRQDTRRRTATAASAKTTLTIACRIHKGVKWSG